MSIAFHIFYWYVIFGAAVAGAEIFAAESWLRPEPYFVEWLLALILAAFIAAIWPYWLWAIHRSRSRT